MCKNGSGVKEVERLFQLALERKLENEEEQQFKDEIKVSFIQFFSHNYSKIFVYFSSRIFRNVN